MLALTLALHVAVGAASIPGNQPIHLGIGLRFTHVDEMNRLRGAQQNPRTPEYRRWLTPQEFGARFGQPSATVTKLEEWLRGAGFTAETSPNRTFINAYGTVAQAEALLKLKVLPIDGEDDAEKHTISNAPVLPDAIGKVVLGITGLDTRIRFEHHLKYPGVTTSFGPQDLRRMYNSQALLDQGFVGKGIRTVVLSTALPSGSEVNPLDVQYFYQNVSDVKAPLFINTIFNPQRDFDNQRGGASEFELDVEMHSVGVPGAAQIVLDVSPASEVFTTGANDIVNNFADAAAVSVSLGICEANEQFNDTQLHVDEITIMRQAIIQGTMEGQSWSAASGDNGANDCGNNTLSVDFPSVIPEMIAAGGVMPAAASPWDSNGAIPAWVSETTWGGNFGAAGGGISTIFPLPAYQVPLMGLGTMRMTPDIALIAGGPGVWTDSSGLPGQLDPVLGTSVASPLSAGFFALIASYQGCRLGDPHAALYQMGLNQADGGTPVFHDITTGNISQGSVTGPAAAQGFDMATGWGSFDVLAMAQNWPGCPVLPDAGSFPLADAGLDPYVACTEIGCGAPATDCVTLPEGPSSCVDYCTSSSACPMDTVCEKGTLYGKTDAGTCIPGCRSDADCVVDGGPAQVCSMCEALCVAKGSPTALIGAACTMDSQCPSGAFCSTSRSFPNGYCTLPCTPSAALGSACGCPFGSECGTIGRFPTNECIATCSGVGTDCGRAGYICQPQKTGSPACLGKCTITMRNGTTFDSCASLGTPLACDVDSGVCGGPQPIEPDAGMMDAGEMDAGPQMMMDAGQPPVMLMPQGTMLGDQAHPGCGCNAAFSPLALGLLLMLRRRSRSKQ